VNVLLIDSDGCGTDMAYRAAEADHSVRFWQPKEKGIESEDGKGFPGITKVTGWKEHMTWAKSGLVINLFNGPITKELDRYLEFGFPVFGPSSKSAALEVKRAEGMQALEKAGIDVPPYKTFTSLQDAVKYAKTAGKRLVFKTMGDEEDKSLSYCSSGPEDMVWQINSWIKQGLTLKGPCMLQDFIDGIECGVSSWMTTAGFVATYNINFEFKKLMPDDYGPATGEMGTVCKYSSISKLADAILKPMEKALTKLGHIGDCDVNCIIDEKGKAWPLEFTNRFGWPSTQILMASHKGDPIKWMKDALNGKDSLKVDERTAIGVLMAAPPFPYPDDDMEAAGLLVSGLEDEWQNVAPWQVKLEKGEYITTGPYVCVVTALAPDVHDAIPKAYSVVERIKFPNRIVRCDIGKKLEEQLPKLHALGYEECPLW
jgi:phosphoribosylamine--glycine ligase